MQYITFYNPYSGLSYTFLKTLSPRVLLEPTSHQNPSRRAGPHDFLATRYDYKKNNKKNYINTQLIKSHNVTLNHKT